MFKILVLIMMLLQLMHTRHTQVFNGKEWPSIKCLDLLKSVFSQQLHLLISIYQM